MKTLTLEAYKILFYLTGSRVVAYYTAVLLLTVLNVIFLMGMCMLLDGLFASGSLLEAFSFPINIIVGGILFIIHLFYAPISLMEVTNNVRVRYVKLLVYIFISLAILAYIWLVKFE